MPVQFACSKEPELFIRTGLTKIYSTKAGRGYCTSYIHCSVESQVPVSHSSHEYRCLTRVTSTGVSLESRVPVSHYSHESRCLTRVTSPGVSLKSRVPVSHSSHEDCGCFTIVTTACRSSWSSVSVPELLIWSTPSSATRRAP